MLCRVNQHILSIVPDYNRRVIRTESIIDAGVASLEVRVIAHEAAGDALPIAALWNTTEPVDDMFRVACDEVA